MKVLISLFDHSGNASKPYLDAGWIVKQIDIKHGDDILTWDYRGWFSSLANVTAIGIIAMVPCTDYALCGARWFAEKDADGRTAASNLLVDKVKEIIDYFSGYNLKFWQIENPASRIHKIHKWMGDPIYKFHPFWFGEPYRKNTWLWGKFVPPAKGKIVEPEGVNKGKPDDWYNKVGGKSERTKEIRSITPIGFSIAFYQANSSY